MEQDALKMNMLAIAVSGLLILLTGAVLYYLRNNVQDNIRYFMPIPPLAVAAYIYVFNMFRHYDGGLPVGAWATIRELLVGTAITAIAFGLFTFLLVILIRILARLQ